MDVHLYVHLYIHPLCNYKKSCKVNVNFSILFNRILFKENIIAFCIDFRNKSRNTVKILY